PEVVVQVLVLDVDPGVDDRDHHRARRLAAGEELLVGAVGTDPEDPVLRAIEVPPALRGGDQRLVGLRGGGGLGGGGRRRADRGGGGRGRGDASSAGGGSARAEEQREQYGRPEWPHDQAPSRVRAERLRRPLQEVYARGPLVLTRARRERPQEQYSAAVRARISATWTPESSSAQPS